MLFEGADGAKFKNALTWTAWALFALLAVEALIGLGNLRYLGSDKYPSRTVTVDGKGEAYAVPDIAQFNFSVVSLKATVADAQKEASTKINAITAYLKEQGVEEKDIKTSGYNVSPQYEWQQVTCIAYPCPSGKRVLKGYEVRQSTDVKVRDTAKAGDLLAEAGSRGATEVSGLTFTVDDEDAVQAEARAEAVADAKNKAELLAKSLGVRLGRVVSFGENNGGYPVPYYYDKAVGLGGASEARVAVAPEISTGENKTVVQVSVPYELR